MNNDIYLKIMQAKSKLKTCFDITVAGSSMLPVLKESDIITITGQDDYRIGDVLVFIYKQGELLVHRLLKIQNGKYYFKGDNSFRLEDVTKEQIIGKVITANGVPLQERNSEHIAMSYAVNREFRKCGYDAEKTKQSDIYTFYASKYLIGVK